MITPPPDIAATWQHATADIPASGLDMTREATADERLQLAARLDIPAVERLRIRYRITPVSNGHYRLEGDLAADVVQSCIVTLDPVRTSLTDRIEAEYRAAPPQEAAGRLGEELSALEAEEYEPIEHNRLDVGRVIVETLAATLPAYPRAADAELEQKEAGPSNAESSGPFAALAGWKPRKDE